MAIKKSPSPLEAKSADVLEDILDLLLEMTFKILKIIRGPK